ncbi:MAG: hypothetical protein N3A67_09445, partial [Ignavibacteria bacterium]|nr:hypothetical protein [Ignavibacteria bacterium]
MIRKLITTVAILTMLFFSECFSQPERNSSNREQNNFVFDYFAQLSNTPDSVEITIFYKIAFQALLFNQQSTGFSTNYQLEASFRDANGIIRRRANVFDTIFVKTFDETKSINNFKFGFINHRLPLSTYFVQIQLLDFRNQVLYKSNFQFSKDKQGNVQFLPIFAYDSKEKVYVSQVANGISFTAPNYSIYLPINSSNRSEKIQYEITKIDEKEAINWGDFSPIYDEVQPVSNLFLGFGLTDAGITISKNTSDYRNSFFALIDKPNTFVPGSYNLILKYEDRLDTFNFRVVWENIPKSLQDPQYMLRVMEYILTDDEIKLFRTFKRRQLPEKLFDYWKRLDPTPNTPYN